jgi:hypothetical protein
MSHNGKVFVLYQTDMEELKQPLKISTTLIGGLRMDIRDFAFVM